MVQNVLIQSHHFTTGSDDLAGATDRYSHEDQEHSSPCAHSGNPGICVFLFLLILAMIQDKAMVASELVLIETQGFGGSF